MALQNFVDNNLPTIKAAWLNAIDAFYTTLFASATTAGQAMTALGFTSLGQSLIAAANSAAARTLLGSTTVGDALFTAATAADARSTLGTQVATGVGSNIAGRTDATTPLSKINITADELIVKDSTGAAQLLTAVSVVIDITVTGANGLDTGAEAISTWYYGYVIAKADGTTAGLLSASATAPTLPTGYTYKARVSAVRNDSSSNFQGYVQNGRQVHLTTMYGVLTGGNALTGTAVDISTVVPPIAREVDLYGEASCTSDGSGVLRAAGLVDGGAGATHALASVNLSGLALTTAMTYGGSNTRVYLLSQTVYYKNFVGNGSSPLFSLSVHGFSLPGGGE